MCCLYSPGAENTDEWLTPNPNHRAAEHEDDESAEESAEGSEAGSEER